MSAEQQHRDGQAADPGPRSLAQALRERDDASLGALLRSRPDLLHPVPTDVTQLATRAGTRASVLRALEHLDRFALQAAEALAVAPDPASYQELLDLLAGDDGDEEVAGALPATVALLRERALVWGGEDRLRLVRTARELLAPSASHSSPTGLGPSVAEATSGMSPGRIQAILTAAGLPHTHDTVSAVAALSGLFADRERVAELLEGAPEASREVLTRLVWGPPYGQVTAEPAAHLRWLLDRGLLLPTTPGTVVLPREAALSLRGGRAHRVPEPTRPRVAVAAERKPQVVDAAAGGQALAALDTVEELLRSWDEGGPAVLRAGGLSIRDLKRTATVLEVPEPVAAFWVELAYAAGLIASDGGYVEEHHERHDRPDADAEGYEDEETRDARTRRRSGEAEHYAPTPEYDAWRDLPPAERWAWLLEAWLPGTRAPGLIGGRDGRDRTLSALGPGLDRSPAPEVRRRVLELMAGLEPGQAPDPATLLERLRWERPLRSAGPRREQPEPPRTGGRPAYGGGVAANDPEALRTKLTEWALLEAEMLGVTGRGALATHGRALLGAEGRSEGAGAGTAAAGSARAAVVAALLAPLLPEPLDHVLLQADLTAVAPGPLVRPLAEALGVLADVESKGGATVYRFTPGSVRRALDAGRSATELHAFLDRHSRTPVPQPLTYLIDDVARRHGLLRVGAASSYVRCDDESVLDEILADRRATALRLRRLAPTVVAAQADPRTLIEGLRAMGFAPAAESAEGDVMIARPHAHRTPPRTPPAPVPDGPPAPDATLLTAAVRAVRAGDRAATAPRKETPQAPGGLPRTSPADTLATVQAAAMTGESVWIGHVNAEGAASQRLLAPLRVEGGYVTGYDHTADEVRTYALHRITGVAELADEPDGAEPAR
ncbi:helicase C-terminal domain-containing protein [Streptomyces albidoflavus]|uniref:DNA-binding protein n=1 Tax=Streptomyces wadayamensis TaxID=141454 RepID=A0ABR4SC79_9ACTN|nr:MULTISPECIES: helicase C-terminal domain-containing protein [Streptomyces]KDR62014.1 DNA-binding protein [Streptomyces wadayamensis]MCL6278375.1 helicase C-terminal domain-containing protein [Streptomyces albidoflavus]MCX4464887.1 helicase C-terminal domain-containing protein [Streptomyces albidoflavus]QXQ26468.1 helicase C-terminal domain-containing protein [Streptomyces albidoflavus]QXQ32398.1 helicase C-terminal domain-containing protein [Streptomyces albidoflavus]